MLAPRPRKLIARRIGIAFAYSAGLLLWMKLFFLSPLADEAAEMHKQQLDPTEIIDIPYQLPRLVVYVGVVFVASMIAGGDFQRARKIAKFAGLSFVFIIICGASPWVNRLHTLWAAGYFSTLLWFDPPIFHINNKPGRLGLPLLDYMKQRLVHPSDAVSNPQALMASVSTQCVIAFSIPAQILLLYDRGWQVQRWPVPLILGSTIGWSVGVVAGTILSIKMSSSSSNKKEEDRG